MKPALVSLRPIWRKKTLVATQNDNRLTGGIELRNINKNLRIETYKNGRRRRSRRRNVHERLLCEEEYQPNLISDQCIVQNTQNTGCGNRKNLLLVPSWHEAGTCYSTLFYLTEYNKEEIGSLFLEKGKGEPRKKTWTVWNKHRWWTDELFDTKHYSKWLRVQGITITTGPEWRMNTMNSWRQI